MEMQVERQRAGRMAAAGAGSVFVVAALLLLLLPVSRAHADSEYKFLQFNMCGSTDHCPNRGSTTTPVTAIANSILDFRPIAVTLNEACYTQYAALLQKLRDAGYPMHGHWTTTHSSPSNNCQNDDRYGNVILSSVPISGEQEWSLPHPGTAETRKLSCVSVALARATKVCVTHIAAGDDRIKRDQIKTVSDVVNGLRANNAVVIGGDFNVKPDNDALDSLYISRYGGGASGHFDEVDACEARTTQSSSCNEGTHDARLATDPKIDYLFVSDADFNVVSGDATHSDISDHDPLRAQVTLGS
jgi:endonuclease/exonuclease/phosphatase family metal-dependent hydrolase